MHHDKAKDAVAELMEGVEGKLGLPERSVGDGPRMYVQLGGVEKVAAHRLAWASENSGGDFPLFTDARLEASHLCSSTRCCVGAHIAMEHRSYNQRRSYCLQIWEDRAVDPYLTSYKLLQTHDSDITHLKKRLRVSDEKRLAAYEGNLDPYSSMFALIIK